MPISLKTDHAARTVVTKAFGVIACPELLGYINTKARTGTLRYDEFFDARDVTIDLSIDDLQRIAAHMRQALGGREHGKIAVLTNNSFVYGMARTFAKLAGEDPAKFGVFSDLALARDWIAEAEYAEAVPA